MEVFQQVNGLVVKATLASIHRELEELDWSLHGWSSDPQAGIAHLP